MYVYVAFVLSGFSCSLHDLGLDFCTTNISCNMTKALNNHWNVRSWLSRLFAVFEKQITNQALLSTYC